MLEFSLLSGPEEQDCDGRTHADARLTTSVLSTTELLKGERACESKMADDLETVQAGDDGLQQGAG